MPPLRWTITRSTWVLTLVPLQLTYNYSELNEQKHVTGGKAHTHTKMRKTHVVLLAHRRGVGHCAVQLGHFRVQRGDLVATAVNDPTELGPGSGAMKPHDGWDGSSRWFPEKAVRDIWVVSHPP